MAAPGPWREPGPYPPYTRRPHSPSAPPRVHPYAAVGVQRHAYYNPPIQPPAMPGFYNPALPQPHPASPPPTGTPPSFPQPRIGLPPSLVPGRKSTYAIPRSHSNDYFFQSDVSSFQAPMRQPQTAPVPPLPRKPDFDQPPVPPKPPLTSPSQPFFSSTPFKPSGNPLFASPEPAPAPSAPPLAFSERQDDVVLHRVLAISAQESRQTQERPALSEEEQLARALTESLKFTPSPPVAYPDRKYSIISDSPEQSPSVSSTSSIPVLDISAQSATWTSSTWVSGRPHVAQQIYSDEALARQLAEEEERLMQQEEERHQGSRPQTQSPVDAVSVEADPLPHYDEAVSSPPTSSAAFYSSSLTAHFPPSESGSSSPESPSYVPSLSRSVSDRPVPPKSSTPPDSFRPLGRSQSCGESVPSPTATSSLRAPTPQTLRSASSMSLDSIDEEEKPVSPFAGGVEALSNTQYLDAELLAGLSMNFGTPPISPSLKPFVGVIPNVIALPYGRTLPFYIKTPSWRNMLKLMARLSGTRLEPTMEAMAVVKTDMRLRIVISFVKVHHASSDWHIVLYMTIDHPVPPNAPTGWKYRNGDTNTLPWSYTLSQLPAFLRDGADAPLSKFYTVPTTPEIPYPVLPISFPTLATYLASVLETSRDAMHDSSSGVRRLAKYVDQFYPNDRHALDDPPERGMRQRLRNLVGMGSKPQRDRNADVYELVTPFMADEYGR